MIIFQWYYFSDLISVILFFSDLILVILFQGAYFSDCINCRFRQFILSIVLSLSVHISLKKVRQSILSAQSQSLLVRLNLSTQSQSVLAEKSTLAHRSS